MIFILFRKIILGRSGGHDKPRMSRQDGYKIENAER